MAEPNEAPEPQPGESSTSSSRASEATPDRVYRYHETRPDEVADAVTYASASGLAIDVEQVAHRASHLACTGIAGGPGDSHEPELCAVSLVTRGDDPPACVVLQAGSEADGDAAKALLDLSLLKLRADTDPAQDRGVGVVRVQANAELDATIWRDAAWLDGLPDLEADGQRQRWCERLGAYPPRVREVVERALERAQASLDALRDAEPVVPDVDATPQSDA